MLSAKVKYAILLALIIAAGIALSIKTVLGPGTFLDFWDDTLYIYFSHYIATYGFNNIAVASFATEYILVGVPAIIFKFFGVSLLTEGMFSMLCLTGTIISIFLIGKTLHNEFAGIISALTFILVPLVAAEGAASGDNMAVAFFATLAVLMLLLGAKKKQAIYYLLSGFIGLLGVLAGSPLNLLVFMFLVPYLLFLLFKNRSRVQLRHTLVFIAGMLTAVAVILLCGYILQSEPFTYFITNYIDMQYLTSPTPNFLEYISILFPFKPIYNASPGLLFWPFVGYFWNLFNPNVIGFFGYAMLASLAYLIIRKQYEVFLPFSWFGLILLYLSFGEDSFSGAYMLFDVRFTIILIPAMAVIIGLAISKFVETALPKKKPRRIRSQHVFYKAMLLIIILAYAFITANSFLLMNFIHEANYILTYQWAQVANALLSLPQNASIYVVSGLSDNPGMSANQSTGPEGFPNVSSYISNSNFLHLMAIEGYAGYSINANFSEVFSNCSTLKGDYIIGVNAIFYENELPLCSNMSVYFSPEPTISLANYEEYVSPLAQITLYKRNH
ncbi:MAG: glycosyltransferase family 39 protein [Candidatus Micrarchaeaceae archaeon]